MFGGPHQHAAAPVAPPADLPARSVSQREIGELVGSGRHRAVIVGTGGRVALPLAWRASRRAGVPFIFWAALWRTPRIAAHLAAAPLMGRIYRRAEAVVTYGPHVSAFVASKGARRIFVAPQAVDNAFWGAPAASARDERPDGDLNALFVGRADRAKGLDVLLAAWRGADIAAATLTVVGDVPSHAPGVCYVGALDPIRLRDFYASSDVLVIPSIRTRRFLEPWGRVVDEAMNQGLAIIFQRRRRSRRRGTGARPAKRARCAGRQCRGARRRPACARWGPRARSRARCARPCRRGRLHVRALGRRVRRRAGSLRW